MSSAGPSKPRAGAGSRGRRRGRIAAWSPGEGKGGRRDELAGPSVLVARSLGGVGEGRFEAAGRLPPRHAVVICPVETLRRRPEPRCHGLPLGHARLRTVVEGARTPRGSGRAGPVARRSAHHVGPRRASRGGTRLRSRGLAASSPAARQSSRIAAPGGRRRPCAPGGLRSSTWSRTTPTSSLDYRKPSMQERCGPTSPARAIVV